MTVGTKIAFIHLLFRNLESINCHLIPQAPIGQDPTGLTLPLSTERL